MQKNIIFTKFIAICLLATFVLFNNNVFAKTKKPSKEIDLVINNSKVEGLDTNPTILNGYTFVPARGVFEILGAVVDWDQKTHEVFIAYKDSIIELEINKKTAHIDNETVSMDVPAKIINNRTMIPVRFIAESFGFKVNWDEKTRTVYILSDTEDNTDTNINNKDENNSKNTDDNKNIKNDNENTNNQNINDDQNNKDNNVQSTNDNQNNKDSINQNVKNNQNNKDSSNQNVNDNQNNKDSTNQSANDNQNNKDSTNQSANDQNNKDSINQSVNGNKNINDQNLKDNNGNSSNKKIMNISNNTNTISVQDLILPQENEPQIFKVKTSGEISKIESFTLDNNRLVIDIYNAQLDALNKEINLLDNNLVSSIKLGQNQVNPQKVTRVVFNLKDMISYDIQFEEEDNMLEVIFNKNNILDINISKDSESDYIRITGDVAPYLKYSIDDDILTILVKNINIDNMPPQTNFTGNFMKDTQIIKEGNSTLKVIANLKKEADVSLIQEGNTATVKVHDVTYKNIKFNSQTNMLTLVKNKSKKIDINKIVHKDDYTNNKYILTLPNDYSDIYGYGIYSVNNSDYLSYIDIETLGENTNITLNSKRIIAINITEDNNNIYIKLVLPKEKYSKILVLDPGHGGKDPGNIGINGLREKDVTLDISNRVIDLLKQDDIYVYATRQIDSYPTLDDRVNIANDVADLFVSIHLNSADQVGKKNPIPNGTEVYYYVNDSDSKFNIPRKQVANIFKNNIINSLGTVDRGVKTAGFVVIKKTNIPSVLLELGFLSNSQEADKFKQEDFKNKAANAIYESIKEVFKNYKTIR